MFLSPKSDIVFIVKVMAWYNMLQQTTLFEQHPLFVEETFSAGPFDKSSLLHLPLRYKIKNVSVHIRQCSTDLTGSQTASGLGVSAVGIAS